MRHPLADWGEKLRQQKEESGAGHHCWPLRRPARQPIRSGRAGPTNGRAGLGGNGRPVRRAAGGRSGSLWQHSVAVTTAARQPLNEEML